MKRIYSKLTHQKIKAQAERHVQQTEEQIRTEAKFIRQEHRITRILGNFFFNRKEWQSGDRRRTVGRSSRVTLGNGVSMRHRI